MRTFASATCSSPEACCRKALELAPDFANAWANLGMTLRARDAVEGALAAWGRALELQPDMRNVAISYGHALYRLDRHAEALEFYRRWQQASPADPIPQHMLAAAGGAAQPARASDGYVRDVFDDFAESFDQNLEQLKYEAPQLLHAALARPGPTAAADWLADPRPWVAARGCAARCCGPGRRGWWGVDLSPKCCPRAAGRGLYDQLNCAELTQWLTDWAQPFDVVVCADVLCYFGDLAQVLRHVRAALVPGGSFTCSLEALSPATAGTPFKLLPHGRYQHDRGYVGQFLAAAGFTSVSINEATLRYERSEPVVGLIVMAMFLSMADERPTLTAVDWLSRSRECLHEREFEMAQTCLRKALALQPDLSDAYELLGKLLYRDSRTAEAASLYQDWLRAVPEHPVAAHLVAATGGGRPPVRAANAFIASLYERAAAQFDATTESLGYRVPQLLADGLATALGPQQRRERALDLGCGTGQCGVLLRAHATRLVGVDLSPDMLELARRRGCYDELHRAELTDFLRSCRERFEIVTAADVFCYFGELAPVCAAICRIVAPGGRFAFSVEALDDDEAAPGMRLLEHGRYAHSRDYVKRALGEAGLTIESAVREMLRFERGAPVEGWIVSAVAT